MEYDIFDLRNILKNTIDSTNKKVPIALGNPSKNQTTGLKDVDKEKVKNPLSEKFLSQHSEIKTDNKLFEFPPPNSTNVLTVKKLPDSEQKIRSDPFPNNRINRAISDLPTSYQYKVESLPIPPTIEKELPILPVQSDTKSINDKMINKISDIKPLFMQSSSLSNSNLIIQAPIPSIDIPISNPISNTISNTIHNTNTIKTFNSNLGASNYISSVVTIGKYDFDSKETALNFFTGKLNLEEAMITTLVIENPNNNSYITIKNNNNFDYMRKALYQAYIINFSHDPDYEFDRDFRIELNIKKQLFDINKLYDNFIKVTKITGIPEWLFESLSFKVPIACSNDNSLSSIEGVFRPLALENATLTHCFIKILKKFCNSNYPKFNRILDIYSNNLYLTRLLSNYSLGLPINITADYFNLYQSPDDSELTDYVEKMLGYNCNHLIQYNKYFHIDPLVVNNQISLKDYFPENLIKSINKADLQKIKNMLMKVELEVGTPNPILSVFEKYADIAKKVTTFKLIYNERFDSLLANFVNSLLFVSDNLDITDFDIENRFNYYLENSNILAFQKMDSDIVDLITGEVYTYSGTTKGLIDLTSNMLDLNTKIQPLATFHRAHKFGLIALNKQRTVLDIDEKFKIDHSDIKIDQVNNLVELAIQNDYNISDFLKERYVDYCKKKYNNKTTFLRYPNELTNITETKIRVKKYPTNFVPLPFDLKDNSNYFNNYLIKYWNSGFDLIQYIRNSILNKNINNIDIGFNKKLFLISRLCDQLENILICILKLNYYYFNLVNSSQFSSILESYPTYIHYLHTIFKITINGIMGLITYETKIKINIFNIEFFNIDTFKFDPSIFKEFDPLEQIDITKLPKSKIKFSDKYIELLLNNLKNLQNKKEIEVTKILNGASILPSSICNQILDIPMKINRQKLISLDQNNFLIINVCNDVFNYLTNIILDLDKNKKYDLKDYKVFNMIWDQAIEKSDLLTVSKNIKREIDSINRESFSTSIQNFPSPISSPKPLKSNKIRKPQLLSLEDEFKDSSFTELNELGINIKSSSLEDKTNSNFKSLIDVSLLPPPPPPPNPEPFKSEISLPFPPLPSIIDPGKEKLTELPDPNSKPVPPPLLLELPKDLHEKSSNVTNTLLQDIKKGLQLKKVVPEERTPRSKTPPKMLLTMKDKIKYFPGTGKTFDMTSWGDFTDFEEESIDDDIQINNQPNKPADQVINTEIKNPVPTLKSKDIKSKEPEKSKDNKLEKKSDKNNKSDNNLEKSKDSKLEKKSDKDTAPKFEIKKNKLTDFKTEVPEQKIILKTTQAYEYFNFILDNSKIFQRGQKQGLKFTYDDISLYKNYYTPKLVELFEETSRSELDKILTSNSVESRIKNYNYYKFDSYATRFYFINSIKRPNIVDAVISYSKAINTFNLIEMNQAGINLIKTAMENIKYFMYPLEYRWGFIMNVLNQISGNPQLDLFLENVTMLPMIPLFATKVIDWNSLVQISSLMISDILKLTSIIYCKNSGIFFLKNYDHLLSNKMLQKDDYSAGNPKEDFNKEVQLIKNQLQNLKQDIRCVTFGEASYTNYQSPIYEDDIDIILEGKKINDSLSEEEKQTYITMLRYKAAIDPKSCIRWLLLGGPYIENPSDSAEEFSVYEKMLRVFEDDKLDELDSLVFDLGKRLDFHPLHKNMLITYFGLDSEIEVATSKLLTLEIIKRKLIVLMKTIKDLIKKNQDSKISPDMIQDILIKLNSELETSNIQTQVFNEYYKNKLKTIIPESTFDSILKKILMSHFDASKQDLSITFLNVFDSIQRLVISFNDNSSNSINRSFMIKLNYLDQLSKERKCDLNSLFKSTVTEFNINNLNYDLQFNKIEKDIKQDSEVTRFMNKNLEKEFKD